METMPKMVTFSGSPPNRAILSCTHCRAATISAWPAFAEFLYFSPNGDRSRYPKIFSLWLTETRIESPFFAMLTPSYATCSMEDPAAYPPPWNHTRTGFLASGSSLFVQIFKDWQCSSCGGMKVIDLMQIPSADGLFQKGLVMSGVMEDDPLGAGEKDGTEIITAMMKALGFDDVAQLETVPYPQLAAAYAKVAPAIAQSGGYIGGGPKKGDYFYGNPFDAGFREHAHQIPMMIGTVYGEFATFAPAAYDKNKLTAEEILEILKKVYGDNAEKVLDAFKEAYPEKNGVDVLAIDRAMREPTVKLAKLFAKGGGKAYLYNFALEFPFQHGKPAWHCSDIPYFFGNADLVEICGIPDVSDKLESEIFGALLAFAKNGTPDHAGLPHWPEVEAEDADTMVFDRKTEVKHNYDDKVFAEINKVLKPWSFMDMMADNIQH